MITVLKKEKVIEHIYKAACLSISVLILIALLWRIQCSISYYDETFNIYVSYLTAVLGQRHLVENGYIFSMGDFFNLPFVYLFCHITGGTEGLLLFIRFVYLGFNLFLAFVCWRVFRSYFGNTVMMLFGLIFMTFFPGGMYTVSYDTVALFFSLLGGILLLGAEMNSNAPNSIYRFFAGICHACMVYSYPLMAGVVALLFIAVTFWHIKEKRKFIRENGVEGEKIGQFLLNYWFPYLLGGMMIVIIFLCYVFYVGWDNIIFFQEGYLQSCIGGREISELTNVVNGGGDTISSSTTTAGTATGTTAVSVSWREASIAFFLRRIGAKIYDLLNYMWIQQKQTIGFTILMLIQWGVGLIKKGKWRLLLIPEILLVAFFMHRDITCFGGTTMYAYCCCWMPFLFCYLEKEERKRAMGILIILGAIAVASFIAIGYTSVRVDKAHNGLYCGAIGTFLLMLMLVKKERFCKTTLMIPLILLIAMCNIGMAYIDHFQGADIKDCTYRMKKGVYKGMMTWEEDIKYENLKTCLEQISFKEGVTKWIYMTNYNYYAACLDGAIFSIDDNFDLLLKEMRIQSGETVDNLYSEKEWPVVILIDGTDADNYRNVIETILKEHYDLVSYEYGYSLYIQEQ